MRNDVYGDGEGENWMGQLTSYCAVHGIYETVPDDTFRICGECNHVYPTAKDLVDLYNQEGRRVTRSMMAETQTDLNTPGEVGEWVDKVKVADVFMCPVCNHDF